VPQLNSIKKKMTGGATTGGGGAAGKRSGFKKLQSHYWGTIKGGDHFGEKKTPLEGPWGSGKRRNFHKAEINLKRRPREGSSCSSEGRRGNQRNLNVLGVEGQQRSTPEVHQTLKKIGEEIMSSNYGGRQERLFKEKVRGGGK